ncbi:uncharacterized protein LOC144643930 isoform X2 [Oculina patagonica]
MSSIEYRILLHKISHCISWLDGGETLLSVSLFEGLIAADSVNNIENAASLFAEMEKQNNLGIDHLSVLKELFRGVQKWTLIDEIEKFEVKRKNYNRLLKKVIHKLGEYDLSNLIEICGRHLAADRKDDINNVCALLKELENTKRLGANYLDVLKEILTEKREEHLLKEVEDFERKRKDEDIADRQRMESETRREARAAAVYAVPRAVGRMMGAVNVHCNFKTVGGVVVAVGAGVVLYKYSRGDSDIQQFANLFNETILPAATNLCAIGNGSLCFTVQVENRSGLQFLWQQYQDGTLQEKLQEFLVTEEIKQLSDGEDVIVTVHIDKQEFQDACLDLMMEDEVFSNEEDDRLKERIRRNSDSVVYVKPKENEVTAALTKLKQAEIKFQQEKIDCLEKEVSRLFEANAEEELPLGDAQLDEQNTDGLSAVPCSEGGDRLDSVVYVKPKESELSFLLPTLKQAEIEFQRKKISSLKKEIMEYKAKVEELEKTSVSSDYNVNPSRGYHQYINLIAITLSFLNKIEKGIAFNKGFDLVSGWDSLPPDACSSVSSDTGIWSQSASSVPGVENLEGLDVNTSGASLVFSPTRETTNFARLVVLLNVCTQVLRETFDAIHPPANLHTVLERYYPIIQSLIRKNIINRKHWGQLYPSDPAAVSSSSFDIILLVLLLQNICGLPPPVTGWNKLPAVADVSREADIARVKYFRNTVYAHAEHASVDYATFNTYWQDIRDTLVRLGGVQYRAAIDNLETECMDPEIEDHYKELIRKFKEDDKAMREEVDNIRRKLEEVERHLKVTKRVLAEKENSVSEGRDDVPRVVTPTTPSALEMINYARLCRLVMDV